MEGRYDVKTMMARQLYTLHVRMATGDRHGSHDRVLISMQRTIMEGQLYVGQKWPHGRSPKLLMMNGADRINPTGLMLELEEYMRKHWRQR
jgi:hypothetical protein